MPDPRLATLRPDGEGRVYTHPLTRHQVPSATTILKALGKAENIGKWQANKAAEEAWLRRGELGRADEGMKDGWLRQISGAAYRSMNKSSEDGTAVHRALELLAILSTDHLPKSRGDEQELAQLLVRPGVRPRAEAFLEWRRRYVRKFLLVEETAWSDAEGGHAGTFDAVVELLDGRIVGVDFKTGNGLYREMCYQQTSYSYSPWIIRGDGQVFQMPQCAFFGLLHLPSAGGFAFVDAEVSPQALTAFYGILRLYRYTTGQSERLARSIPTGGLEPVPHLVDQVFARALAYNAEPAPWEGQPVEFSPADGVQVIEHIREVVSITPGGSLLFQAAPQVPEMLTAETMHAMARQTLAAGQPITYQGQQVGTALGAAQGGPEVLAGLPVVPEAGPSFQPASTKPPGPDDDLPSGRKELAEFARAIGASPAKTNAETIKRIRARQAELAEAQRQGVPGRPDLVTPSTAPAGAGARVDHVVLDEVSAPASLPDTDGTPGPPLDGDFIVGAPEPDLVKSTLTREMARAVEGVAAPGPGQVPHMHGVDGWSEVRPGVWVCATPFPGGARCGFNAAPQLPAAPVFQGAFPAAPAEVVLPHGAPFLGDPQAAPAPLERARAEEENTGPRKKRCGVCHQEGHNARTCTSRERAEPEDPDGRIRAAEEAE